MKFNDYLDEAPKIEGDPKLYKKMEEIRKKCAQAKGKDITLSGELAKAMADYLQSTLNKKVVNEGSTEASIKKVVDTLKKIKSLTKSAKKDAEVVFDEVFGSDPADSAGVLCNIFDLDDAEFNIDSVIDYIEDYED